MSQYRIALVAFTLYAIFCGTTCFAEVGPVFAGTVSAGGVTSYKFKNTTTVRACDIFQKHLNASNPVQWGRRLPGNVSSNFVTTSPQWQAVKQDLFKTFGRDVQVRRYVEYQEYLMRKSVAVSNTASARSLDIKGSLAESIMDDFFKKDGWESLDGKRGRNGFDGLYVKRSSNGRIIEWIAADAKSGNAKLGMTNRGMQLSPEWLKGNLEDLLATAKAEHNRTKSPQSLQRVSDFEALLKLKGRSPRVFSMKLETHNGAVCYKLENVGINGTRTGNPVFIDMQSSNLSPTMLKMREMIYKDLKKQLISAGVDEPKAQKIVTKMQKSFETGKLKTDSGQYRFIKSEITDKQLANAVSERLGKIPPRGSLAGRVGQVFSRSQGVIISSAIAIGFVVAQDIISGNLSVDTLRKVGIGGGIAAGTYMALDYGVGMGIRYASIAAAKHSLRSTGKRITEASVSRVAAEIAPTLGRAIGGVMQIGFAGIIVTKTLYDYNHDKISQTDAAIQITIVSLATAGTVFFTCSEYGAALGTAICPGAGTTAGTIIGAGIGVVAGVASGGYTWYAEKKRQKRLEHEIMARAEWETENNKQRLQERIRELELSSQKKRAEAWAALR